MLKSTYGTGCFALLNTGTSPVVSKHRLLTTIAYQLGGVRHYALEGSIFVAGAAVQWLRDTLCVVQSAAAADALAEPPIPRRTSFWFLLSWVSARLIGARTRAARCSV